MVQPSAICPQKGSWCIPSLLPRRIDNYGRPYEDATSFVGWMRELLPVVDGGRRWEVINAGGISYASYRVANIMQELCEYELDLFIIYTEHNKFLEARTYRDLKNRSPVLHMSGGVLSRTRIYTLLTRSLGSRSAVANSQPDSDGRMLMSGEVNTLLDSAIGPDSYRHDDPLRRNIMENCEFKLLKMARMADAAGSQVILVAPASNLADCSPFKSELSKRLSAAERQELYSLLARAKEESDRG